MAVLYFTLILLVFIVPFPGILGENFSDYVVVPGGLCHRSCVHEVLDDQILYEERLSPCPFPFRRSNLTHGVSFIFSEV